VTLQRRLLLMIVLVAPLVWAAAAAGAWWRAQHEIDELYDTELVRLARQVLALLPPTMEAADRAARSPQPPRDPGGAAELRTLSVSVWIGERRVMSDTEGAALPWRAGGDGFVDLQVDGAPWRVYYLNDPLGGPRKVAVGQELAERAELAEGLLLAQLWPWLASLPVLLVALALAVRRALAPMRALTRAVERRDVADLRPVGREGVPVDLVPLVGAIDRLLARLDAALRQERRFTADAAHELRTPIATVRAHWDAMRLSTSTEDRDRAAAGVSAGIDRLGHLVSQMLAMARADAAPALPDRSVDWRAVVEQALGDTLPAIEARDAKVEVEWPADGVEPMPVAGDPGLLASMLRNLVDNAVRYGPQGGRVRVTLGADRIVVEDSGPGLDAEVRTHLGERFHRSAGAVQPGSGLGVSIVARVAALHGLVVAFDDRRSSEGVSGLRVTVSRATG
jgi:two-component system sensor histidine kinase QseC